ncbi:DUF4166 domain-containing protein [Microbulbifer variabilis]|uniref:DUF4166 domain-containing protein n=1 Tax=Microbulbifer variabilis TaxID=266805 RepID=UPI001CFC52B8|nr:DUF4166 domain-containing protein [Microbulbifer variabilis]
MTNIISRKMGASYQRLSPVIREVHSGRKVIEGEVTVERGALLAQIICSLFSFPKQNKKCSLRVECHHSANNILWMRNFDGLKLNSYFFSKGNLLFEQMGPLRMYFTPVEVDGSLTYHFVKTKIFGIPLPGILSPKIYAREYEVDGTYQFEVKVSMIAIGKVLSYGGAMSIVGS